MKAKITSVEDEKRSRPSNTYPVHMTAVQDYQVTATAVDAASGGDSVGPSRGCKISYNY